jgi:mannose-1-phosphate guanylyltransferase/mannose-6-phosphate isomerase
MPALRAAILCGGAGTRLWPLSRDHSPKQFHPLVGELSLLSETVARALNVPDAGLPLIITGQAFAHEARAHAAAGGAPDAIVILEPKPRNTAAAAALAAYAAAADDPSSVVALLPSDHHISDGPAFVRAIQAARVLAEEGAIVTLGIVPDSAHTGYGYIKRGAEMGDGFKVERFVEKPDPATAAAFFADDSYYWNAGIFLFRADVFLSELKKHRPDIANSAELAWTTATRGEDGILAGSAAWDACPSDSIDYAVAEKTDRAAVVPANMGWNDVGSWSSLMELASRDDSGNAVFGDARMIGAAGCYVRSTTRHVSVIGASDLIVVETADAILIVHKDATQQVKQAAEAFKKSAAAKAATE